MLSVPDGVPTYNHSLTINVPVVFMAWYVMILRGATSLRAALEGVGPENRDFFGPKKVENAALLNVLKRGCWGGGEGGVCYWYIMKYWYVM